MSEKPNYTISLWLTLEGLCILAYALKPSPTRKLLFVPIAGLSYYSLFHTNIFVDSIFTSVGLSSRFITVFMHATANILMSEPQKEVRIVGDKRVISDRPLRERLWWAWKFWGNPRGVGWSHEIQGDKMAPKPQTKSRLLFLAQQMGRATITYLLFDAIALITSFSPYAYPVVPELTGWQRLWRLWPGYGPYVLTVMELEYQVVSIVCIALGFTKPSDWPALFGSVTHSYTLGRFWRQVSKSYIPSIQSQANIYLSMTWHQMFRNSFITISNAIVKVLPLPPKGRSTAIFKLFATFFMSAVLHQIGEYSLYQNWTENLGTLFFFGIQPFGILLEKVVLDFAKKQGIKSSWWTRAAGYAWVWVWLSLTMIPWVDPVYRKGWRNYQIHKTVVGGLLLGTWEWK